MKQSNRCIALLALLCAPKGIEASPYTISDDRIRSLDINPALGRGYSIATNSFKSTCLMVDEVNTPSYNYDCKLFGPLNRLLCFIHHHYNPTQHPLCTNQI